MSRRYGKGESVSGGAVPYEIERDLSVGMFAVSYAARRPDGSRVFLKQYKSPSRLLPWYREYIDYQRELKRRVENDPTLASRTYEFADMFEADGAFVQVFGFIEGGRDLRSWLDAGIPSPLRRWEFAWAFLSALDRFHDSGIVHTDLKPENIYLMPGALGSGWNVKLIDFDFTVLRGMAIPWQGRMGWVGTPRYMSPEHLTGKVPEERSDVFTASLILHELLAGGHPYPAEEEAYLAAVRAGPPPPPRLCAAESPETAALAREMARALTPDTAGRPSSRELLAVLRAARDAFKKGSTVPMAPPDAPRGGIVLAGTAGRAAYRLDTVFGRKTLAALVGEEDARFAEAEQFRIARDADRGTWFVSAARADLRNPPMLDGSELGTAPQQLRDGATLYVASSRKNPGVRKGELRVRTG